MGEILMKKNDLNGNNKHHILLDENEQQYIDQKSKLLDDIRLIQETKIKLDNDHQNAIELLKEDYQKVLDQNQILFDHTTLKNKQILDENKKTRETETNHNIEAYLLEIKALKLEQARLVKEQSKFEDKARSDFQEELSRIKKSKQKIAKLYVQTSKDYKKSISKLSEQVIKHKQKLITAREDNKQKLHVFFDLKASDIKQMLKEKFELLIESEQQTIHNYQTDTNALINTLNSINDQLVKQSQNLVNTSFALREQFQQLHGLNKSLNDNSLTELEATGQLIDRLFSVIKQESVSKKMIRKLLKNQMSFKTIFEKHTSLLSKQMTLMIESMENATKHVLDSEQSQHSNLSSNLNNHQNNISRLSNMYAELDRLQSLNQYHNPGWINELKYIFTSAYDITESYFNQILTEIETVINTLDTAYDEIDELERLISFDQLFKSDEYVQVKIRQSIEQMLYNNQLEMEHLNLLIQNSESKIVMLKEKLTLSNHFLKIQSDNELNDSELKHTYVNLKEQYDYQLNEVEQTTRTQLERLKIQADQDILNLQLQKNEQYFLSHIEKNAVSYQCTTKVEALKNHREQLNLELNQDMNALERELNQLTKEETFKLESIAQTSLSTSHDMLTPLEEKLAQISLDVQEKKNIAYSEIRQLDFVYNETLEPIRLITSKFSELKQNVTYTLNKHVDTLERITESSESLEKKKLYEITNSYESTIFLVQKHFDQNMDKLAIQVELPKPNPSYIDDLERFKLTVESIFEADEYNRKKNVLKLSMHLSGFSKSIQALLNDTLNILNDKIVEIKDARAFSAHQINQSLEMSISPLEKEAIKTKERITHLSKELDNSQIASEEEVKMDFKLKIAKVNDNIQAIRSTFEGKKAQIEHELKMIETEQLNQHKNILDKHQAVMVNISTQMEHIETKLKQEINRIKANLEKRIKSIKSMYQNEYLRLEKVYQNRSDKLVSSFVDIEHQLSQMTYQHQSILKNNESKYTNLVEDITHQYQLKKSNYDLQNEVFEKAFEKKIFDVKQQIKDHHLRIRSLEEQHVSFLKDCINDMQSAFMEYVITHIYLLASDNGMVKLNEQYYQAHLNQFKDNHSKGVNK